MGFITYSEGCNDDVNKMLWSAMGWRRDVPLMEVLRDYARYFIGPDFTDDFAQGLMALERNWRGTVLTNAEIENTLAQFQTMERRAGPAQMLNWRFQQGLYRAYYDAYVRRRLIQETAAEQRATDVLRRALEIGSANAMKEAHRILTGETLEREGMHLRTRIFQLAEALYQSIRMQLSVERYGGMNGRGNTLDTLDIPLNSRIWLSEQFSRIGGMETEKERLAELHRLAHWTDSGPGGFYDDLGNPLQQPHLVAGAGFAEDP
jgi:hypothetical protein